MSEFNVFYSWLSDLPNATNRSFIEDALKKACKQLINDPSIELAPRVDKDTQGLAGSPSIPQAIMDKIDGCHAFVADVTLCFTGPEGKLAPNPNVVYELGYAVARLGWDRIIMVMNEEHGTVENLPFDLEKRRAIPYRAQESEQDRSVAKKNLVERLTAGIKTITQQQPVVPKLTPTDEAIAAIGTRDLLRRANVDMAWSWILEQATEAAPDLVSTNDQPECHQRLKDSHDQVVPLLGHFGALCRAIAMADDREAAEELTTGFGRILQEYDYKLGVTRGHHAHSFDYWRILGRELFLIWVAHLIRLERWDILGNARTADLIVENQRSRENAGLVGFAWLNHHSEILGREGERISRTNYHADFLKEAIGIDSALAPLNYRDLTDADRFLHLASILYFPPDSREHTWWPWVTAWADGPPTWLVRARQVETARLISASLGLTLVSDLQFRMKERLPDLQRAWQTFQGQPYIDLQAIMLIGSQS